MWLRAATTLMHAGPTLRRHGSPKARRRPSGTVATCYSPKLHQRHPAAWAVEATRFIPISRRDMVSLLGEDPRMRRVATLLHHVMDFEADHATEALRRAYAPFDPDPLEGTPLAGDPTAFLDSFDRVMEDGNFRRIGVAELQEAFDTRSLFPLHAEVDLDEYDILRLHRRGVKRTVEQYRGAATLWRWRKREIVMYERLVIVVRLKEEALTGPRTMRTEGMDPGKIYIKSFKNIPTADLEMVLPNTRLRMRKLDRIMVGGPLVAGVGATVVNSINIIIAILAGAFALSLDDPYVRAFGGVLIVLAGYLWRTHSKIKTTRLQYLRTLSSGLYFRNLANNAAVIDQVLHAAGEEEQKEAILAFALLQAEPMSTRRLDQKAEAWLLHHGGRVTDFDVQDGLDSLEALGLVHKRRGKWHALAPGDALDILDARWDAAF